MINTCLSWLIKNVSLSKIFFAKKDFSLVQTTHIESFYSDDITLTEC